MFKKFIVFLKEKLKKEKYKLVKTIDGGFYFSGKTTSYTIYFHLYESNKNNRKFTVTSTYEEVYPGTLMGIAKKMDVYNTKIHRWLAGRYDPDIPSYNSVDEEDTMNALRGRVE